MAGSSLWFHLSGGGRGNGSRRGRRRQPVAHFARRQTGAFGGPRKGGADSGGEGLRPVTCERHSAGRLKPNESRRTEARAEPERTSTRQAAARRAAYARLGARPGGARRSRRQPVRERR